MTHIPPPNDPSGQYGAPPPPQTPPQMPPAYYAAPQPAPYYANQQYAQGQQNTDGLAITSLVLGCIPCGAITGILAIIFGFVAKSRITKSNGTVKGSGMATAGIILGFVQLVFVALYVVLIVILAINDPSSFES